MGGGGGGVRGLDWGVVVVVVGAEVVGAVVGAGVAVAVAVAVLDGVGAEVVGPRVAVTCGKASVSWLAPEMNPVGRRDELLVGVGLGGVVTVWVGVGVGVGVAAWVGIRVTVSGLGVCCWAVAKTWFSFPRFPRTPWSRDISAVLKSVLSWEGGGPSIIPSWVLMGVLGGRVLIHIL